MRSIWICFEAMCCIFMVLICCSQVEAKKSRCPEIDKSGSGQEGSVVFYANKNLGEPVYQNQYPESHSERDMGRGNIGYFWYVVRECRSCGPQVLYVRVHVVNDQPVSLYKNFSSDGVSGILAVLVSPFFNADDSADIDGTYLNFDKYYSDDNNESRNISAKIRNKIKRWEDPFWFFPAGYLHSFIKQLVKSQGTAPPQPGAERLIRLQPNRDRSSWICVESQLPKKGGLMEIGVGYGGDSKEESLLSGAQMEHFFVIRK